ncbi:MAG: ATP-binding cassette domain-containing protein [Lachnospiraceae bacterium]|nr:ATP-binding cassette domain-containing protein [Lachnospiraceae bacterium]
MEAVPEDICLVNVSKAYGERKVLTEVSLQLKGGRRYCLMGASGVGKTTLLRLILGLEQPEVGAVTGTEGKSFSVVFQENRLFEFLDGVSNIRAVQSRQRKSAGKQRGYKEGQRSPGPERLLGQLLDQEDIGRTVAHMSGGMKRRVALARALAHPSDFLLLDEPFSGLDGRSKQRAISVIKKYQKGRTIILVTHQEEDAAEMGAEIIRLPS